MQNLPCTLSALQVDITSGVKKAGVGYNLIEAASSDNLHEHDRLLIGIGGALS